MKNKKLMPRFTMWKILAVYVSILCCNVLTVVKGQTELENIDRQNPCSHQNAIGLPNDKKCLVPVKTASTWAEAGVRCESVNGTLYETPDARIGSRPELMRCLTALSDSKYDDMWIKAVGGWSPHFFWINGTWVNKVDYCTVQQPARDASDISIASDTLSVDYCVSTCHDIGARYIVLHKGNAPSECYCRKEMPTNSRLPCVIDAVDFTDTRAYYVVHSKEDSLIKIASSDVFTSTEIMCATVDSQTLVERQMKSETCFTRNQFICCLGEAARCVDTSCFGPVCRFLMRDKCMLRVSLYYSWYAARAYCVNAGGDLWNMHEFNEMTQVNQYLQPGLPYWIGATNYAWTFNGTSDTFAKLAFEDPIRVRCGHMFKETDSSSSSSWQWSDAECTQQKSFLCQFNKTDFTPEELKYEVTCPWATIPTISSFTSLGNFTYQPDNNTAIPYIGKYDTESFPIAAIIAAIIAGIILLTCLCLAFTWCSRSHMMAGGFRRVRERLAFIPYFADIPVAEYEGHGGMSSFSDHGSQVGLVKGGYHNAMSGFAMSSSYAEQSGMFSSKSMDRRQEGMDKRLARSSNYMASGNSSSEERGFAAASNTMSSSARDYMTLQAQMNILDEAEIAALRESFRRKPEVSLVTDNVDMNFTVNHAVSQGQSQAGSDLSRSSVERTVEEVIAPVTEGGLITLSLPERVVDEARIYSTMKTTYNV